MTVEQNKLNFKPLQKKVSNSAIRLMILTLLSGCSLAEKLATIGEPPPLSQIQDPTLHPEYQPVSMPMPDPIDAPPSGTNSLWQVGSKAFFKDQRANKVGDIVTVDIEMDQEQSTTMTPDINQKSTLSSTVGNLYGIQSRFPKRMNLPNILDASTNPSLKGSGSYNVKDKTKFKIAATVTQLLPNGAMVIEGRQEVGLVNEVREIYIKGIVRREDISSSNTITAPKIAQLRIGYRGRGELSDNMAPPIAHQIINKLSPF